MIWALTGCTLMLCWREVSSMFSASAKTLTIKLCHSHHIRNPAKKLEFCDIILSQTSCSSFLQLRCSYFTMSRDVQLMWISDTTTTTTQTPPPPKKKKKKKTLCKANCLNWCVLWTWYNAQFTQKVWQLSLWWKCTKDESNSPLIHRNPVYIIIHKKWLVG